MTDDLVPAELIPVEMPSTRPQVVKLAHYVPLATSPCEHCGETVVYNLTVNYLQHEDPAQDVVCLHPWPGAQREAP